jgi:hypothetical protein
MHDMDANTIFTALPCLASCTDYRADRCRQRLGEFYLRHLAGEKLEPPPINAILSGCCRSQELGIPETGRTITFFPGKMPSNGPPPPPPRPWWYGK